MKTVATIHPLCYVRRLESVPPNSPLSVGITLHRICHEISSSITYIFVLSLLAALLLCRPSLGQQPPQEIPAPPPPPPRSTGTETGDKLPRTNVPPPRIWYAWAIRKKIDGSVYRLEGRAMLESAT